MLALFRTELTKQTLMLYEVCQTHDFSVLGEEIKFLFFPLVLSCLASESHPLWLFCVILNVLYTGFMYCKFVSTPSSSFRTAVHTAMAL